MHRGPLTLDQSDPVSAALAQADPELGAVIARVGKVELGIPSDPFEELVGSIVSQQLSTKAAGTIWRRLGETVPITPEDLASAEPETLRGAGLSNAKVRYVQGIARAAVTGDLDFDALEGLDDEEVIARLTTLKGVGRWTAEMFLLFALRRPDVLAVDDLGIRTSAGRMVGSDVAMERAELAARAEMWKPHRSAASLWLWASLQ